MTRFSNIGSVLIDSNILVIAHTENHPRHGLARELVADFLNGKRSGVLAHQNLLEFYATVTNKHKMDPPLTASEATQLIAKYQLSRLQLIIPTTETLSFFIKWQASQLKPRIGPDIYDWYLAATMLSHKVSTILTEDTKDFQRIPGITAVNPFI